MRFTSTILAVALSVIALTACNKKEESQQSEISTDQTAEVKISAQQQALIDSVDKPEPEAIAVEGEESEQTATTEQELPNESIEPVATSSQSPAQ